MKSGCLISRVIPIVCCGLFVASVCAQTDAQFAKANQAYGEGHFKEAVEGYEAIVPSGKWSANLFYDLGNAYFRAGRFGRAILNYERALSLDRHHPESRANLQIARDEARALEMQPGWLQRYLGFATVDQYSIAAAGSLWLTIFCIAVMIFTRRKSARTIALLVLSSSIFAITLLAIYRIDSREAGSAIVTSQKAEARLATADNAGRVLALPAGSEIQILSRRGDWIYAALPNNLRGWLPAGDAERIRL